MARQVTSCAAVSAGRLCVVALLVGLCCLGCHRGVDEADGISRPAPPVRGDTDGQARGAGQSSAEMRPPRVRAVALSPKGVRLAVIEATAADDRTGICRIFHISSGEIASDLTEESVIRDVRITRPLWIGDDRIVVARAHGAHDSVAVYHSPAGHRTAESVPVATEIRTLGFSRTNHTIFAVGSSGQEVWQWDGARGMQRRTAPPGAKIATDTPPVATPDGSIVVFADDAHARLIGLRAATGEWTTLRTDDGQGPLNVGAGLSWHWRPWGSPGGELGRLGSMASVSAPTPRTIWTDQDGRHVAVLSHDTPLLWGDLMVPGRPPAPPPPSNGLYYLDLDSLSLISARGSANSPTDHPLRVHIEVLRGLLADLNCSRIGVLYGETDRPWRRMVCSVCAPPDPWPLRKGEVSAWLFSPQAASMSDDGSLLAFAERDAEGHERVALVDLTTMRRRGEWRPK
jgi:hypothetical protein